MNIRRLLLLVMLAGSRSLYAQNTTTPAPQQIAPAVRQPQGRSIGGDVGSGTGDIGKGAGKGAGDAAVGVGKGAGDLVTLHPVGAAGAVGTGAAKAGKNVAVGTGKGAGKIGKGIGKAIAKPF